MPEFIDPYVYPGTSVLRNKFGIRDREELSRAEYAATWIRRQQLEERRAEGRFDLEHLRSLHHQLFQDVFDWAGNLRSVDIAKGASHFMPAMSLISGATYTFDLLASGPLLRGSVTDDEFLEHASTLLGNLNYIHPFREGNGRTQRAFLDDVAASSGRMLTWRNVSEEENISASAASVADPNTPALKLLLAKVILPPFDTRPILDDGVYRVISPVTVTLPGDEAEGMRWLRRNSSSSSDI